MSNYNQNSNKERGFSLIELVIYIGIASLIILILSGTIVEISRVYMRIKIYQSISQNGNNAMQKISREIAAASSVNELESDFITEPNTLVLEDSNGEMTKIFVASNSQGINQLYLLSPDQLGNYPGLEIKNNVAYAQSSTIGPSTFPTPTPTATIPLSPSTSPSNTINPTTSPVEGVALTSNDVNIVNLNFSYSPRDGDALPIIRVSLILASPNKYNVQETYTTTINLRNY